MALGIVGLIVPLAGIISLVVAGYLSYLILKKPSGTEKMRAVSHDIYKGAMAFLKEEYKIMSVFIIGVIIILFLSSFYTDLPPETALSFFTGAIFSALAGNIGMRIATHANVRTTEGVKKNVMNGLLTAFSSGAVMGLTVVGLGVLGVYGFYVLFQGHSEVESILFGFGRVVCHSPA